MKLKRTDWVDSITFSLLSPLNKEYTDNMSRNLLKLNIDEETAKQTITTRLKELYISRFKPKGS